MKCPKCQAELVSGNFYATYMVCPNCDAPPIHSDPAGEDDFIDRDYEEITKRLKDLFIDYRVTKHPNDFVIEAMRLIEAFYIPNKLSTPQTGREEDYKKLYLQADERATRLEAKLVDLRLQTGRTFSEEEVEQIAKDYVFNIYEVIDGQEVSPYLNKREGDLGVRAAVAVWKIMNNIPLTKQNSKP